MKTNKYKITPISTIPNKRCNETFPLPMRCLIIGSSGSGKTTLLWNLITKNWIPYRYLYIFSKSIEQQAYVELQRKYKNIENEINEQISFFYKNCEDIISVDECNPNSLIIFDDCILEEQDTIKEYFVRGRHKNISCIYISQCYSLVDLKTIRNNLNFLCIFKQNEHYMKMLYNNFIITDMTFEEFKTICVKCWTKDYGFLSIDLTRKTIDGKFKNELSSLDIKV